MPGGGSIDRGVIRRVEADQHAGAGQSRQPGQRAGQDLGADLGTAAAAAHRVIALHRRIGCWYMRIQRRSIQSFQRHTSPAGHRDPVAPGHRASVAEAEDGQRARAAAARVAALWPRGGAAQVGGQRRAGAHRPDAGFRPRIAVLDRRAVAGGEHEADG